MVTGYNDPGYRFDEGVDAIVREARAQGIRKVIWLTMRTADVTYVSPEYESDAYTFRDNNRILLQNAVQHRGYLQIADWATYSANRPDWFGPDGVHYSESGGYAVTTYIRNRVRTVLNGHTITPVPGAARHASWSPVRYGDYGSRVVTVQQALIDRGIAVYGGADGQFGSYTKAAVETFQRRRGLRVSGVVYEPTAIELGIYTPPPPPIPKPDCRVSRALAPGDELPDVRCLKRHLASAGFAVDTSSLRYGTGAAGAARYYKAIRGYRVDGVAGGPMLRALGAWRDPPPRPDCLISRALLPGDRLPAVRCLKRHLRSRGYWQVPNIDYGTVPRLAVRNLKLRYDVPRPHNGIASTELLRATRMWRDPPPKPDCRISRVLRPGDVAPAVVCLKRHLAARGFDQTYSREYGPVVTQAVRHIKRKLGWPVDGVAGRPFLTQLRAWRDPSTATAAAPTTVEPAASSPTTTPTVSTPASSPPPPPTSTSASPPAVTTTAGPTPTTAPPTTLTPPASPPPTSSVETGSTTP